MLFEQAILVPYKEFGDRLQESHSRGYGLKVAMIGEDLMSFAGALRGGRRG